MQGGGRKGRNRQDRRVGRPSPLLTHIECGEREGEQKAPQEAGQETVPPTRHQNRTNPPPATELIDQRQKDGRVRLQSQKNRRKREPPLFPFSQRISNPNAYPSEHSRLASVHLDMRWQGFACDTFSRDLLMVGCSFYRDQFTVYCSQGSSLTTLCNWWHRGCVL